MTLRCSQCDGVAELYDDNGADYPETRVEFYRCVECGNEWSKVLTA
mgnify:CR=1 FL=1